MSSCGRPAIFGNLAHRPVIDYPAPMRICIDRDGSLYPSNGPAVDEKKLGRRIYGRGYLLPYYVSEPTALTQVYQLHGITAPSNLVEGWPILQSKLRQEAATRINKRLTELGATSTLVILIHGFNNTSEEARASYDVLETEMRRQALPQGAYQVVEVYWDGRHGAIPFFFRYSQPDAQFVGLALRGIINQVSHDHPIRIITHSLGTLVGCNALWNVNKTMSVSATNLKFWQDLKDSSGNCRYFYQLASHDATEYRTPTHPNIRLGSIAAAIPGQTYDDYLERTPKVVGSTGLYKRVVITNNPTDKVLNKFWIFAPLNKYLGITTLGRSRADYQNHVPQAVTTSGGKSFLVPFYIGAEKHKLNHSLSGYATSKQMPVFLTLLFSNTTETTSTN
jgi:hypothetical protein